MPYSCIWCHYWRDALAGLILGALVIPLAWPAFALLDMLAEALR